MLEPTGPHGTHLLQTGHQVSIRDPICHTRGGSVHVFKANSLSHMFLVMACNSHPAWLFLLAVASLTETCMFSMIWALTLCISPYMSGVDHTCAAIPCAFGKVHGRFGGLGLRGEAQAQAKCAGACSYLCHVPQRASGRNQYGERHIVVRVNMRGQQTGLVSCPTRFHSTCMLHV